MAEVGSKACWMSCGKRSPVRQTTAVRAAPSLLQLSKKKETGAWTRMWTPMIMYAAVNTPGLRNGNWTRKAKTQGGEDGGRRGENHPGIMRGLKKKWLFQIHHGGECSCLTAGWYWRETFFYLQQGSLRPDWLDGVMSPGTTCSVHQDRHLLGKRIVCFADYCFSFHVELSALISCPDYTTIKLQI